MTNFDLRFPKGDFLNEKSRFQCDNKYSPKRRSLMRVVVELLSGNQKKLWDEKNTQSDARTLEFLWKTLNFKYYLFAQNIQIYSCDFF